MKSAREMFEDLGYEFEDNSNNEIEPCRSLIYRNTKHNLHGSWLEICFELSDKHVDIYMCDEETITRFRCNLSIKLLQAINKQIEELNWK